MFLGVIGLILVLVVINSEAMHGLQRRLAKVSILQRGNGMSLCLPGRVTMERGVWLSCRTYHQPRYLSSATLLAEWCYGSYDDLGVDGGSRVDGVGERVGRLESLPSGLRTQSAKQQRSAIGPLRMSTNPATNENHDDNDNLGFTPEEMETIRKAQLVNRGEDFGNSEAFAPDFGESSTLDAGAQGKSIASAAVSAEAEKISMEIGKADLREEMREWRKLYSEEYQVPVYTVFSNKVLDGIVESMPTTEDELRALPGVGEKTLNKIKGKVLPLVQQVLDGKPLSTLDGDVQLSDSSSLSGSTSSALAASRSTRKSRHSARMAAILANLESQQTINQEDLNDEQIDASETILEGQNTFITGSAGTGKSFLLRYLVQELREKHGPNAVAVTASTGIAAINLGGQTVHSFAGIGLSTGSSDNSKVINKVLKNMRAVKRWQDAKVLIIDEISMIDRPLFELLDMVARAVRRNDEPFGGIQIVVVGDFSSCRPCRTSTPSPRGSSASRAPCGTSSASGTTTSTGTCIATSSTWFC